MIRSLRKRHLRTFVVLAVVLPLLYVAGLLVVGSAVATFLIMRLKDRTDTVATSQTAP